MRVAGVGWGFISQIAELIAGFSAAGQRHRDAGDSALGEGSRGSLLDSDLTLRHRGEAALDLAVDVEKPR